MNNHSGRYGRIAQKLKGRDLTPAASSSDFKNLFYLAVPNPIGFVM